MSKIECPLFSAASKHADEIAIVDGVRSVTYRELHLASSRLADFLRENGFQAGDRVCFQMTNSWQMAALFWACFRNRCVAAPISHRIPIASRNAVVESVNGRLVSLPTSFDRGTPSETAMQLEDSDPATIIFSSGTTGTPKAVVHSLRAHLENAKGSNKNIALQPGDRWLLSLPLFHVGGLAIVFRSTLAGSTMVIDTSTKRNDELIFRHQISHASMVATQLKSLLATMPQAVSHLKAVLLGGSTLPPEVVRRARENDFPLFTTYGLSEMASQVTTTPRDVPKEKWQTAGKLLDGREIAISREGEILVRGATLFAGYCHHALVKPATNEAGWFATSDMGRMDSDGYLRVTGRLDNMFISGGENVHPEEIESLLLDLPGIRQAVVIALPDSKYGQRPVAIVDSMDLDESKILQHLERLLPRFKIPDRFFAWPKEMPQQSIKPSRKLLTDFFRR